MHFLKYLHLFFCIEFFDLCETLHLTISKLFAKNIPVIDGKWWNTSLILALRREGQVYHLEFEAGLVYIVSSRNQQIDNI